MLFEETLEEQVFDFLKLILQILEFLVVVFLDGGNLLSHIAKLVDLVLHLVLELTDFILEIVDTQLVQHDHIVVSMFSQEALEADAAQVILAKSLNILRLVYLALGLLNLANLVLL